MLVLLRHVHACSIHLLHWIDSFITSIILILIRVFNNLISVSVFTRTSSTEGWTTTTTTTTTHVIRISALLLTRYTWHTTISTARRTLESRTIIIGHSIYSSIYFILEDCLRLLAVVFRRASDYKDFLAIWVIILHHLTVSTSLLTDLLES